MKAVNWFDTWVAPFISLLAMVDPAGAIPVFLAMTEDDTPSHRRLLARNAAIACGLLLAAFALGGKLIFQLFSITMPAFRVAGGFILGMVAVDMLKAHRETRETQVEIAEGVQKLEIAITPLAMPMLAGPASIATVMILMGRAPGWSAGLPVLVAIALVSVVTYVVLRLSEPLLRILGRTGINLMSRLMGVFLLSIAVQFVFDSLREVGLLPS